MKPAPILFSGPMVRAILDGRKTQTRRVAFKPWTEAQLERAHQMGPEVHVDPRGKPTDWYWRYDGWQAGDLDLCLWVRETWCDLRGGGFNKPVAYRADSLDRCGDEDGDVRRCRVDYGYKWTPSIHMPKWASRLTLRVTDMRLERVQDISEDDAEAEGADLVDEVTGRISLDDRRGSYRDGFTALWDSINAERGYTWAANPETVAVTFEAHRKNIEDMQ